MVTLLGWGLIKLNCTVYIHNVYIHNNVWFEALHGEVGFHIQLNTRESTTLDFTPACWVTHRLALDRLWCTLLYLRISRTINIVLYNWCEVNGHVSLGSGLSWICNRKARYHPQRAINHMGRVVYPLESRIFRNTGPISHTYRKTLCARSHFTYSNCDRFCSLDQS